MKIHTFFEPVNGFDKQAELDIIQLWETYWGAYGWETEVLSLADVSDKDLERANNILDNLPQGGQRQYNMHCLLRWFVMKDRGGFMADYDIFPIRKVTDEDLDYQAPGITVYQPGVTCLLHGTKEAYENMIEQFERYNLEQADHDRGCVMEMHMLRRSTHMSVNFVRSYLENGWENHDVIHFPNAIMNFHKLQPRAKNIEEIMSKL